MLAQGFAILLLSVIVYFVFSQIILLGVFRHVYNHTPGKCFRLSGIENGSEDIRVLPNGQAFISSGLRFMDPSNKFGKIYLFDFHHPNEPPVELKIIWDKKDRTLNPHGIDVWTDQKTGNVYLYVINHPHDGEAVDKFKYNSAERTLEHVRRIQNEANFHVINDLTIVEEDKFFYTNYLYVNHDLEIMLRLNWGSVGFFDGKSATLLEKRLLLPNGIALSRDKKFLYVALLLKEEMWIYQRNDDNSLKFLESVALGTLADNLDVDMETGDVWTGAHPSGYKLLKHMENVKDVASPSHVLRIRFSSSHSSTPEVMEIYSDDGNQISASSVAVRYKNGLLVGSVDNYCVYCSLECI